MGFDCCDTRGQKTRTIKVYGKQVGIQDLNRIFFEVKKRNLSWNEEIQDELLKRVKEKNYVSSGVK